MKHTQVGSAILVVVLVCAVVTAFMTTAFTLLTQYETQARMRIQSYNDYYACTLLLEYGTYLMSKDTEKSAVENSVMVIGEWSLDATRSTYGEIEIDSREPMCLQAILKNNEKKELYRVANYEMYVLK